MDMRIIQTGYQALAACINEPGVFVFQTQYLSISAYCINSASFYASADASGCERLPVVIFALNTIRSAPDKRDIRLGFTNDNKHNCRH
jgi:hypothetical protein